MGYRVLGDTIVMRLEIGEEIMSAIANVCDKEHVTAATIMGIGATGHVKFGAGNEIEGNYEVTEINEKMEILNLTGDVSLKDGKCMPHVHIIVAGQGGKTIFGGHLEEGTIFSTADIFIRKLDGVLNKKLYPECYPGHSWWLLDV
ncbi:MAG: DUF296 domain-containing protein [Eubacteriales bacterium]|nr:DUF296 domain-containing protein [Eubacteriales bacterium]